MILPSKVFIDEFKKTPGAFSVSESIALMNITSGVMEGNFVECGSNAGKSGMSAAYGLPKGTFYMIDPIFDLKNIEAWGHTIQGHPDNLPWAYAKDPEFTNDVKERIIFASNGRVKPVLCGTFSEQEIPKHDNYTYAFIDSDSHQHEMVFSEINLIKDRMVKGGIIALHDVDNQYIAPREAIAYLVGKGEFEEIIIDWKPIFDYVRENNLEEGNNSWHEKGSEEFPKFVGACRKK